MIHRVLRALFAGTLVWGLLLAAPVPAAGQVTAETELVDHGQGPQGHVLVSNPMPKAVVAEVELHRWSDTARRNVGPRLSGAVVWPDSFRLRPGIQQTVRLLVPDSLGLASGDRIRVVTTLTPPFPEADTAAEGVAARIRHRLRLLSRATIK